MDRISSNPFLTPALLRQSADLRASLQRATEEMTTGKQVDPGKALRGDFSGLAATDHALARLAGYEAATTELTLIGTAMQSALSVISETATGLGTNLLRMTSAATEAQLEALSATGYRDFTTVIATLNTRLANKAIFAGNASDRSALPDAETVMTALETAITGASTVQEISDEISAWFNGATGYQALYNGGTRRSDLLIASGETASFPYTALDPAIRETLTGLAKVALLHRGGLAGNHADRAELALSAGNDLFSSSEARAVLAGRIGSTEQQVAQAQTRNSAEKYALSTMRNGLTGADPYEAAVRLQDLEGRLDAFYTITARLSRLSLTGYLR